MDFASLRAKLDNIAEELAQLPEQETVAVEEENLSEFSPADMKAANKDSKAIQKSGSGMKSTSAARPQVAGTLAQRLKTEEVEEETIEEAHMMPKTLKCKECGDMLGCPTTDCRHDSMDPAGPNWIMVDVDNDGDMDMAMANEEEPVVEGAVKDMIQDVEEGMGKEEFEKKYPGQNYDEIRQEIEDRMNEETVEEATVEVPVQELADLMQLAGYANYADKIEEYANEPDEQYQDAEDQLIGLSGGLNGPKDMHTPAAGGDNPMDKEALKTVEESLYKSYRAFLEEAEITEKE